MWVLIVVAVDRLFLYCRQPARFGADRCLLDYQAFAPGKLKEIEIFREFLYGPHSLLIERQLTC